MNKKTLVGGLTNIFSSGIIPYFRVFFVFAMSNDTIRKIVQKKLPGRLTSKTFVLLLFMLMILGVA